eukprot:TRINITY_DN6969_c3_g1_i1.p1 TRINITY_DN6969_c3_g1~~TRINITY_DN6969_c3_g1_i1.p1  ORF type:complete len:241 (+),score=63.88 TRINITY_DN6969_c3_g1_i1:91-723(+)
MAFLASPPEGFAAAVGALNAVPAEGLRRAASHTVRAQQRRKPAPSAEDFRQRLEQAGCVLSVAHVRSVLNWLDYLYAEARSHTPEIQEFGKRVRRCARGIQPELLEVLWEVWEKDGAPSSGVASQLLVAPQLVDMQWRLSTPAGSTDARARAPSVGIVLRTQAPDGSISQHGADLPYAGFLELAQALEDAREALRRQEQQQQQQQRQPSS